MLLSEGNIIVRYLYNAQVSLERNLRRILYVHVCIYLMHDIMVLNMLVIMICIVLVLLIPHD